MPRWPVVLAALVALAAWARCDTGECPLERWTLDERQNRSQVAFTAVVESCADDDEQDDVERCQRRLLQPDGQLSLGVRIKKVFKGLSRQWEGRAVRVDGVRDRRLCPSRVRLRDTRIVLADYADHEQAVVAFHPSASSTLRLRLNSSLVTVSLRHLQQLRAYTKGIFLIKVKGCSNHPRLFSYCRNLTSLS